MDTVVVELTKCSFVWEYFYSDVEGLDNFCWL